MHHDTPDPQVRVHLDWGPAGAGLVRAGTVAVVVDVLSFTTTVSVATDLGVEVLPHPLDADATGLAGREGAVLAGRRGSPGLTLSPASLRAADSRPGRLVLPSPNGSALAHQLATRGATVVAGCLRNAAAVASWIATAHPGADVQLVPGGERWPDGSLRPGVEDLWGAGAIADHLTRHTQARHTPEAGAAAAAWLTARPAIAEQLAGCVSGIELTTMGFAADVAIAAEVDTSASVPLLIDGRFRNSPL